MNRKVITLLLAATMVMSLAAIGTVAAKTTTQKIEFNLNDGEYCTDYPDDEDCVPASAVLTGNIMDRDGTMYLSILKGTITLGGVNHKIQVKSLKQSEPITYEIDVEGTPNEGDYQVCEEWFTPVEINIQGDKYIGYLEWTKCYGETDGNVLEYEYSLLYFFGIVDGNEVECGMIGDFPL